MVRGLVQQKRIGAHEQYARQFSPHAPSTTQFLQRAVHVVAHEADTLQDGLYLCIVVGSTKGVQPLVRVGQHLGQFHQRIVVGGRLKFLLNAIQGTLELLRFLEGFLSDLSR